MDEKYKWYCATMAFCVFMLFGAVVVIVTTPYTIEFEANENFRDALSGLEFNDIQTYNDYRCQDQEPTTKRNDQVETFENPIWNEKNNPNGLAKLTDK